MATLTSGLATFGKIYTYLRTFVAVIVGIILFAIGVSIRGRPDKHTSQTSGKASNVVCTTTNNTVSCTAPVSYTVKSNNYTFSGTYGQISNGQTVSVYYNPANPGDAISQPVPKFMGTIMIIIGLIIIFGAIGFAYFFSQLGNQGKAVVGGAEAVGEASRFFSSNS